jgi:polar amino acid transport system substrate-binding protein
MVGHRLSTAVVSLTLRAAGLTLVATLTCAASAFGSTIAPNAVVPSVARLIPAGDRGKTFVVPENATYAPDEFIAANGHTIEGMDPDLVRALSTVMGIKLRLTNVSFDEIIPGLVSGKYQISVSSIDDTKQRERQVTFVDYARTGQTFVTRSDSGITSRNFGYLCGLTVAVEYGTTELSYVAQQSSQCLEAGAKPVTIVPFPNQTRADHALETGLVKLILLDAPVADYTAAKSDGKLVLVGKPHSPQPFGVAVSKGSHLAAAVQAGLRYLVSHGYYAAILTKWRLGSITIPASQMVVTGANG